MIVIDASVLVNVLADDGPDGDLARSRLAAEEDLAAPQLLDLEVISVVRRNHARQRLDRRRAEIAVAALESFPVDRFDHLDLLPRVWELRDALSAYDACYVALAELLECPLLTVDVRLAKGAAHGRSPVEVEVLPVP